MYTDDYNFFKDLTPKWLYLRILMTDNNYNGQNKKKKFIID